MELLWSLLSPIMILAVQVISYMDYAVRVIDKDGVPIEVIDDLFWELIAWTAFVLWVRFLLMLRSYKFLSASISMIFSSFNEMVSYLIIVGIGVLCFTNAFTSVRQYVYIQGYLDRPFDKNAETDNFWDWKDKWLGEYLALLWEIFVGAVIGLELDQSEGFTDSQMILFVVSVIFNMIVLMNLLLAVVGAVQSDVAGA